MNFFKALFRMITLYDLRQSWKLNKAGDAVFTGSAEGRSAAFDLEQDRMVKDYNEFLAALSEAELAVEQKQGRLDNLEKQRKEAQKALDGALTVYSKAQEAADQAKMDKAKADGKEYSAKVKRLSEQEAALREEITTQQEGFKNLEHQLAEMKERIANLPTEKADSIAAFVSNQAFIKAQQRLDGILTRSEASPLDAVRLADQELAAKAKVVGKLAGKDKSLDHDEYLKAAEGEAAEDEFDNLLAARKAQKATDAGTTEAVKTDRPVI